MDKTNTSYRLKEYMNMYNLKQVDILEKCKPYCDKYNEKINKSHLSQWVNGSNEPNQRKLSILSQALNVQETWLMGYDVPMKKIDSPIELGKSFKELYNNMEIQDALVKLSKLQPSDQEMVVNLINSLYEKVSQEV